MSRKTPRRKTPLRLGIPSGRSRRAPSRTGLPRIGSSRKAPFHLPNRLVLAVLVLWGLLVPQVAAQTAAPAGKGTDGPPTEILALELRKDDDQLKIHFLLGAPTPHEVVDNLAKRVLVVKFPNARAAFPGGKTQFLFNDSMVAGIAFDRVSETATWAKISLQRSDLVYALLPAEDPNQVILGFRPAPPSRLTTLSEVRINPGPAETRVVMQFSSPPRYEADLLPGRRYLVRLIGVAPALSAPLAGEDERVVLGALRREGDDTLLEIELKPTDLKATPLLLTDPARLIIVFSDPGQPAPVAAQPEAEPEPVGQPGESLELLLGAEPSPAVRANYSLAEREFRTGRFQTARRNFLRVFNANSQSKLGIRAYFRAADARYELLRQQKARNYHGVIINYQTALRGAERAGYESELIPHAIFRIARSYQHMGFHNEAHVHFAILRDRFPDDPNYTVDSYFYQGRSFTQTGKYEDAVRVLEEFIARDGDPALLPPALYALGDAFFNLKRYPEAKREFDRARRGDAEYPNKLPVLLFHMGETYYETAKFDVARTIYRILLERFPARPFSKLVGLRLGDFLREEGKEADALRIYRQVIENAPLEITLLGRMRIADILAARPVGEDYKKAIAMYGQVIEEGGDLPIVEEALMRKALTQTLHNLHRGAIDTFQEVEQKYPESPFVKNGIVGSHVVENLQALVDKLFAAEAYWDVTKIYTTYRDPYFRDFRFNVTLFQVARSYHFLGLYDEALRLYDRIIAREPGSLLPMVKFQKAIAYTDKDDFGKAERELLDFIKNHPEDPYVFDARLQLGRVYFEGRRYQDALNAYRILKRDFEKESNPTLAEAMPEVFYQLGRIHKELGRLKEAEEAYRAAVENFHHPLRGEEVPESIVLSHFILGDVLFELGQDQEAAAAYEIAIGRYPEHDKTPWAQFQIGLMHRRNGREKEALEVFNGLVELAKNKPGELWETLAKENQRDLVNALGFQNYLKQ